MTRCNSYSAGVTGLGAYLPYQVITNEMLAARLDTTDEWITSRTGILERRFADESESTSDLAVQAGRRAICSGNSPEIEALVLATSTPDYRCPATAPKVAAMMGLGYIPAFDISAVCSGFLYAVSIAVGYVSSGLYNTVLVIAAEKFSSLIDHSDRTTACLFGDGAGAVVISRVPQDAPGRILALSLNSNGTQEDLIRVKRGGARYPFTVASDLSGPRSDYFLTMKGSDVFTAAVSCMTESLRTTMNTVGWDCLAVDWIIAHQANKRIVDMVCKTLGIAPEKGCLHLDVAGNTAGASIPLALAAKSSHFKRGDKIMLTSFGAGTTWGSVAMSWPDIDSTMLL